jgi:hypothetical protein
MIWKLHSLYCFNYYCIIFIVFKTLRFQYENITVLDTRRVDLDMDSLGKDMVAVVDIPDLGNAMLEASSQLFQDIPYTQVRLPKLYLQEGHSSDMIDKRVLVLVGILPVDLGRVQMG